MITVRIERPEDYPIVRKINTIAFERPNEADLVDALRRRGAALLSLVGEKDGRVVGHILFSPVAIRSGQQEFPAVGLAPMAVLPNYQGHGIGKALVQTGLEQLKQAGHGLVVVLGHKNYYPRFGFRPARPLGIEYQTGIPDEYFLVAELLPGALSGVHGQVHFQPEFSAV
jgi:putative acetyltransferase